MPVALCFTHLELLQSFDALQQPIQVTSIARKAAAGWRGLLLERSLVFLGFGLILQIPWSCYIPSGSGWPEF